MHIRQRWMAWPWGVFGLILAAILAGVGVFSLIAYPDEKPSVRLAVPMFSLALYWVFALLCNHRSATITPKGVRVFVWPLVVLPPQKVKRSDIRHCYFHEVQVHDDGVLLESYYSAGVERINGEQIEVSTGNTAEEAERIANQIATVLNHDVSQAPVGVCPDSQPRMSRRFVRVLGLMGVWLALFLGAIFVGVAWETAPR